MDALELDEWINTLEAAAADHRAALEVIDQRLPILRDLRATFDTPVVEVAPPATSPTVEATPSKPATAKKAGPTPGNLGDFPCDVPGCARVFHNPHGLLVHQRRMHKAAPAATPTPAPKLAAVPPPANTRSVSDGGSRTVYRCGSDDLEFTSIIDLTHHTLTDHDRRPSAAEKILVTPDSARSSA